MSHYSEIMKKKSWLQKLKKMLMHIPNYKLNRIIDKTYRPFNVKHRTHETLAHA